MNALKKLLGILFMLASPIALFYLVKTGISEMIQHQALDVYIQWTIFIIVFVPIVAGFFLFGWYSWKGEYHSKL